jgi:hypothetical protein
MTWDTYDCRCHRKFETLPASDGSKEITVDVVLIRVTDDRRPHRV